MMNDNAKLDAVIKLLDIGGITLADVRSAPLAQVVNLRNLLHHWHQLTDAEIQARVERTRPKS
jgi:hypothetical protein